MTPNEIIMSNIYNSYQEKYNNLETVILWISCDNLQEYNNLQEFLINNNYQWVCENFYYDNGMYKESTPNAYRYRHFTKVPNMFITIHPNNKIDFFHSIINVSIINASPQISSLKYLKMKSRKLKLQKLKNYEKQ